MFTLSSHKIKSSVLKNSMLDPQAGAFVVFEGWVRNRNDGKNVFRLDYEAYNGLCVKEANRIIAATREKFSIIEARCVHRVGRCDLGDLAVWIGVTAVHRDAAFKACRYIIDEIKTRLPIWKKEYYENGDSGWIRCEHDHASHDLQEVPHNCGAPSLREEDYYSRQMLLPQIGEAGQNKLMDFLTYKVTRITNFKSAECPLCSMHAKIIRLEKKNYDGEAFDPDTQICLTDIPRDEFFRYTFIDVRELAERLQAPIDAIDTMHFPMSRFDHWNFPFEKDKNYLLFCSGGKRSLQMVKRLHERGITNARAIVASVRDLNRYTEEKISL